MKVLFSSHLQMSVSEAKRQLAEILPELDFTNSNSLVELEKIITDAGLFAYVDLPEYDYSPVRAAEQQLITRDTVCDILTAPDVIVPADFNYCEIPSEEIFSATPNIEDVIAQLQSMQSASERNIDAVLSCVDQMKSIASKMDKAGLERTNADEMVGKLEELQYNYRMFDSYHRKRIDVAQSTLDTFRPLALKVTELSTKLAQATNDNERAVIEDELTQAQSALSFEKNKYPVFSELFTDVSGNFSEPVLQNKLSTIRQGAVVGPIQIFSTKGNADGTARSIKPIIKFNWSDPNGLLAGEDLSFTEGLTEFPNDETPHGILYDMYYNILGDMKKMFTDEERGLSANGAMADPELAGQGQIDGLWIANAAVFKSFYEDFSVRYKARQEKLKAEVVEPALQAVVAPMEEAARNEVLTILAFDRAYETGTSSSAPEIIAESKAALAKSDALARALAKMRTLVDAADAKIASAQEEFKNVECAKKKEDEQDNGQQPNTPPGSDPFGIISLTRNKADDPDPTKQCYWLMFAAMATAVNVLPVPGPGGFKYWPIGLIIPTPGGPLKIPLPIIWLPLIVIPTPIGLFVMFIGLCGIMPSPFLFYMGTNGEKKFIVSLRPTQDFGNSGQCIKEITSGGIAVPMPILGMLSDIKLPTVPGVTKPKINLPNTATAEVESVFGDIMKAVQKLGIPELPQIKANATIAEKKAVAQKTVDKYLSKLKVPDISFPKDNSKVNPKPLPLSEVIGQVKRLSNMNLPHIAPPTGNTIDLKEKLTTAVNKIDISKLALPSIPEYNPKIPGSKNGHETKVKEALNKWAGAAMLLLTPEAFGISSTTGTDLSIFIPFMCLPGIKGIQVPPIPAPLSIALNALKFALGAAVAALDYDRIVSMLGTPASNANIGDLLKAVVSRLNLPTIPDPSSLSISNMTLGVGGVLSLLQMPSLPAPGPITPRITIPGETFAAPIRAAVSGIVSTAMPDVDVDRFVNSPVDAKAIITEFVGQSQQTIQSAVSTVMAPLSVYQSAVDLTFPKMLGLIPKIETPGMVPTVQQDVLKGAMTAVKALSAIPYPAVCFAPQLFKQLHPVLKYDDIPPWERLSVTNFLFVCFLDEWCTQGKKGGGFLENP